MILPTTVLCLLFLSNVQGKKPTYAVPDGKCIWYGIGATNPDKPWIEGADQHLNAKYDGPAKPLTDPVAIQNLEETCPLLVEEILETENGNLVTCCDSENIEIMKTQMDLIDRILGRCSACVYNMKTNFCYMTCHPRHSSFLVPTEYYEDSVKTIEYFVNPKYTNDTYDSCDNVYFPELNTEAIFMFCGSYGTDCNPYRFFDYLGDNDFAPFFIDYNYTVETYTVVDGEGKEVTITPLNPDAVPCYTNDTSLACSCTDCQEKCGQPPSGDPPKTYEMIGSLRAYEFSLLMVWLALTLFLITYYIFFKSEEKEEKIRFINYNQRYSANLERYLNKKFGLFGTTFAKYPLITIACCAVVVVALSLGLLMIDMTADPVELWASPDSRTREEKDYFDEHFNPFYRTCQVIAVPKGLSYFNETVEDSVGSYKPQNISKIFGPVLHQQFLLETFDLHKLILAVNATYKGRTVTLSDVCIKPMAQVNAIDEVFDSNDCLLQNVFNYWQNNRTKLEIMMENNSTEYLSWFRTCTANPTFTTADSTCLGTYGGPVLPYVALGGFLEEGKVTLDNANYDLSTAISMTFLLQNYIDKDAIEPAKAWEKEYLKLIEDYSSDLVDLAYYAERSIEDELLREGQSDVSTIAISYLIMFLYVTIALGKYTEKSRILIDAKITLGLVGVTIVLISVVAAMGFCGYAGIQSTIFVVEVVPFLVLAIGVDNIFLIVQCWQRLDREADESLEEHVGRAVGEIAPSILITTSSEAICFFLGGLSNMPAVYSFALCAGMALFINFILQLTCFVAVLAIHARRVHANRFDILYCIKKKKKSTKNSDINVCYRIFEHAYGPFITHKVSQLIIIILFFGAFFVSSAYIPRMKVGLEQNIAFSDDSYIIKYFEFLGLYLSVGTPVYFVVKEGFDYTQIPEQNLICSSYGCDDNSVLTQVIMAAKNPEETYIATGAQSWIEGYFQWISDRGSGLNGYQTACCRLDENGTFIDSSEPTAEEAVSVCLSKNDFCSESLYKDRPLPEKFMLHLPDFLIDNPHDTKCTQAGHPAYGGGVKILGESGTNESSVGANFYMAYHTILKTSDDFTNALDMVYKITDNMIDYLRKKSNSPVEIFPYSVFYVYYEQYLTMWNSVGSILGISTAAVMVVMFCLTGFDLLTTCINTLTIVMIIADIMGCMYAWGIDLNAVSLVNLVMAIGISVEFCGHFTHSFNQITVGSKRERAIRTLSTTGASILSGITLTKIMGILVLAFANSEIFIIYYFRMFLLMVLVGVAHGLIFLPALVTSIGHPPNKYLMNHKEKTAELHQTSIKWEESKGISNESYSF